MTERKTSALLGALALAFGIPACGAEPGEVEARSKVAATTDEIAAAEGATEVEEAVRDATIHLSERLDTARIESPLTELEPAEDLAALADPAVDLLLDEGFEEFDWRFEGWPTVPGAGIVAGRGGKVLQLEQPTQAALAWALPVRTDAFYRFSRMVQALGEPFCDFYVVESRSDYEEAALNTRTHFLAGRGEALKIHSLPIRSGEETGYDWQQDTTSFYPTPRTRSLVVLIRPRVGADPGALVRAMAFDNVRLEEVLPTRKERMRLLKGAHAAPTADPALGLRKAGWLLPLPSPDGAQDGEPAESNYNWRRALYAPPKTELAFDLSFPEGARLRLGTGLARETPPGATARFQVEIAGPDGSEPEVLLDRTQAARMEEWRWEELDVDLSAWAGKEGTLLLRTLSEKGDPHPLWSDPRIEAAGHDDDPLVILIAVDTLRADRLSAYGYERHTTPALDRLAADGILFDQARSNCNWTCPSFASIFTGLVPSRHGVSSYGPATPLPDELVTLAEHFQSRGWDTRSIAYKVPLFDGNYEQGFDEAFNVPRDVIRGEENLARALEWLETHRGGPTFLFLHFNDPHQPFVQPKPFDRAPGEATAASASMPMNIPGSGQEEAQQRFSDLYDGAVSYVDSCIGRFLDSLRERGLYDKASVVFVADHGEQFWEHGRFGHGGADLYDEIVRVPLIVKPPVETFEIGRVLTANVSGFDVMPTLLELGGIDPPEHLDARSLVPLMSGAEEELGRVVVTETSLRGLALVDGGYKFVLQPGGAESLYHLESDPAELNDVASERPTELERLRSLAIAYVLEHRPGNYVLAHAGEQPANLVFSTRAARTLVGPAVQDTGSRDDRSSSAELPPSTWALFELEGPGAPNVQVEGLAAHGPTTGFQPWVTGGLPFLSEPGVWRVTGPEPAVTSKGAAPAPVDAEVLEALRRLGYVE